MQFTVTGGRYKGKVGYYDDDDCISNGQERAVVYFGEPFKSEYYLVKHEYLKNVVSINHEIFKNKYPEFCEQMGIV